MRRLREARSQWVIEMSFAFDNQASCSRPLQKLLKFAAAVKKLGERVISKTVSTKMPRLDDSRLDLLLEDVEA